MQRLQMAEIHGTTDYSTDFNVKFKIIFLGGGALPQTPVLGSRKGS